MSIFSLGCLPLWLHQNIEKQKTNLDIKIEGQINEGHGKL